MQQLDVVARLFPLILSGEKRSTIRWRETRIVPGPMRYVCDTDPERATIVRVLRCTDMPLSKTAAFLGKQVEWPKHVLLEGMREHYPGIGWHDIVQVVEHLSPEESSDRDEVAD